MAATGALAEAADTDMVELLVICNRLEERLGNFHHSFVREFDWLEAKLNRIEAAHGVALETPEGLGTPKAAKPEFFSANASTKHAMSGKRDSQKQLRAALKAAADRNKTKITQIKREQKKVETDKSRAIAALRAAHKVTIKNDVKLNGYRKGFQGMEDYHPSMNARDVKEMIKDSYALTAAKRAVSRSVKYLDVENRHNEFKAWWEREKATLAQEIKAVEKRAEAAGKKLEKQEIALLQETRRNEANAKDALEKMSLGKRLSRRTSGARDVVLR